MTVAVTVTESPGAAWADDRDSVTSGGSAEAGTARRGDTATVTVAVAAIVAAPTSRARVRRAKDLIAAFRFRRI
ncbi:hypothetical protein Pth03_06560 [Planotetraspora thailandica]|uniref:Uncharacterized protein n=1 Tax=Planotetraspora thailandica TaxID=487172 RepID=A0A8J3XRP1_9ACTN|nr:hypothetical protein Pth03_06560 [Planotetraspora thailandica]